MEEQQDRTATITREFGLTEDEARIFVHLVDATDLYEELSNEYAKATREWTRHYHAMARLLMWRVIQRDYPNGWRTIKKVEELRRRAEDDGSRTRGDEERGRRAEGEQ